MRPIWFGTKPPLNQSVPSPPWAMLPPSSDGVTPDAAAAYDVTIGSLGPGGGAGGGGAGGGAGVLAGGGSCGEFDESMTLLPDSAVVSTPPPQAARLAASAATSCRRIDTSIIRPLLSARAFRIRCCARALHGSKATKVRCGKIVAAHSRSDVAMLQAIACNATV